MANLEESPLFDKELLPVEMEDEDLSFDLLEHVMPGDLAYFAIGNAADMMNGKEALKNSNLTILMDDMVLLGELGEKPGKADVKVSKLKTRNYQVEGHRTSTVELTLVGLSEKQIQYLESPLFQGQEITILLIDGAKELVEPYTQRSFRVVIFLGMRWTVDWSAEVDGLWTVILSTSMNGATANTIRLFSSLIEEVPE